MAAVCDPRLPFDIDAYADVAEIDLHGAYESGQRSERSFRRISGSGSPAHLHEGVEQRRGQQARQRAIFRRFEQEGRKAPVFRVPANPVQQYSLADATKPDHEQALGSQAVSDAVKGNGRIFNKAVAPGQFGRGVPAPGA